MAKLDRLFAADKLTLLFSQELLDEFVSVARRPKFRKYFSLDDLQELLTTIRAKADFVVVTSALAICRDAKDNFLLSLAVDGRATHLLSGDKDLLVLDAVNQTKILSVAEYLALK